MHIGGFTDNYVAEDYATWLNLMRNNWRSLTVPVESYERAPANLSEYAKRQGRYACQTFQLVSMSLLGVSLAARLRLLKGLHYYSLPVVSLLAAIFLISVNTHALLLRADSVNDLTVVDCIPVVMLWINFMLASFLCPLLRARAEGVLMAHSLAAVVFEGALVVTTAWPITCRLISYWAGKSLRFAATGIEEQLSFRSILRLSGPGLSVYFAALLSILSRPALSGLNLIWAIPAVLSPIIVYRSEKVIYERRREAGTAV